MPGSTRRPSIAQPIRDLIANGAVLDYDKLVHRLH